MQDSSELIQTRNMAWTPLAERFQELPLILAGPILRRVEPRAVSVWLALKQPREVTLRIFAQDAGGDLRQLFEGTGRTVRLGDHLHISVVTAHAENGNTGLAWGEHYSYDLLFRRESVGDDHPREEPERLDTPGILNSDPGAADALRRLCYPGHSLPGFVLPPADLNQVRIVHGSCRKPHGVGKEMLSALDTILEDSVQKLTERPQQLFMTGDQIYADDVSASLLFTLTDAGNFLLTGNQEEVLPLVNAPARQLPPQGRKSIVRDIAMFTTSTPENHLLTLAEYSAMYLFAWSDVLWPKDVPDIESLWRLYPQVRPDPQKEEEEAEKLAESVERLREFHASLPRVRRALANIATYTICDDHDVTDDWFLDGAWCQRVLENSLGRRIVRNGLLAYALFQGWGNTPEQFAGGKGAAFLAALDEWRGDEADPQVETLERALNLPATFVGSGEMPRTEQALDWHYTVSGPRHHVIVMDTRTQRFYFAPTAFPGLLSPRAMHTQVAAALRQDRDINIIISATPVLGVDFVEAIQFWSRFRSTDNYTYDREAWGLEEDAFQHLLRTVSVAKRVVFLAGDVHYAFGSSLDYWDLRTKATAKIVNYTSSSLRNEGSGSQMTVLAVGYPQLHRLSRRQGVPTIDFFAWDGAANNPYILDSLLKTLEERTYQFWWSLPKMAAVQRSPYEIVLRAQGWPRGAFNAIPPSRSYRVRYLPDVLSQAREKAQSPRVEIQHWLLRAFRTAMAGINLLERELGRTESELERKIETSGRGSKRRILVRGAIKGTERVSSRLEKRRSRLVEMLTRSEHWLNQWKAGSLIVGYNNIGEIRFQWTDEEKCVIQRLWWCHPGDEGKLARTTEYRESLELPRVEEAPPLP